MTPNTSNPMRNYAIAGLSGAAVLATVQKLSTIVLPALIALWDSLTGGATVVNNLECGNLITGDNNDDNIVFCDELTGVPENKDPVENVTQLFIRKMPLLDVNQVYEWQQFIENHLKLHVDSHYSVQNTSMLYDFSDPFEFVPEPLEHPVLCVPPMTFTSIPYRTQLESPPLSNPPATVPPTLPEKPGTQHCDNVSIPVTGSHWCDIEDAIL